MFRVLHIMAGADAGGISTVVLNYYKYMDKKKIRFDIAVTTNVVGQNGERFKELGSKIYRLPLKSEGIEQYKKELMHLLTEENFDAIHVHENETSYVALSVAKIAGIKVRIAHAHTSAPTNSFVGELRRISGCFFNNYYATTLIACGQLAGDRVFGKKHMKKKKAYVLSNAVEIQKFAYCEQIRNDMRNELHVDDKYVVGMVGRLEHQKNCFFALSCFKHIHEKNENVIFLIVGNGEDEEKIREFIKIKNMDKYVRLLGRRSDVEKLYQAFDLFILPSLYEGFPVVAVEALTSGLPVILSDTITKELEFSKLVKYLPLQSDYWIDEIAKGKENQYRENGWQDMKKHNFDITDTAKKLEMIYLGVK